MGKATKQKSSRGKAKAKRKARPKRNASIVALKERLRQRRGPARDVERPVDAMSGLRIPELPEGVTRRCPECNATLTLAVCPACQLRDLLRGGLLRKIHGPDWPHKATIGLDLRPEDHARYLQVRAVRERFPGAFPAAGEAREKAIAELAAIEKTSSSERKISA